MASRLGSELRRLRTERGLNATEAALCMGCSVSKISRQESGKAGIRSEELDRFLDLYQVHEGEREEVRALLGERNIHAWWLRYDDVLTPSMASLIAMENAAAEAREYQLVSVPGLLQTRAFARSINRQSIRNMDAFRLEGTVEIRLRRQRRLVEEPKLRLHALMWEGALTADMGGSDIRQEQLRYLLTMSALPNVTLQVIPFSAGRGCVFASAFQILSFPEPEEQDQLFVESLVGMLPRSNPRELAQARYLFDQVTAVALSPQDTRLWLKGLQ